MTVNQIETINIIKISCDSAFKYGILIGIVSEEVAARKERRKQTLRTSSATFPLPLRHPKIVIQFVAFEGSFLRELAPRTQR